MMNILITIDDNYIEPALTMLFSLKLYNDNLIIHVIYDNLSEKSLDKLKKFVADKKIGELKLYYFNSENLKLTVIKSKYITKTCYFRLYAPFIIKDVDRILYLDPDIVCQAGLEFFYNEDLGDKIIAGCINMLRDDVKFLKKIICDRLKLPYDVDYINSGVLLIDAKKYREFITADEITKFLQDNKNILHFQDQDTINKLFLKKIKIMDTTYNYQINAEDYWKISLDKVLIHYSENNKPWTETYNDPLRAMPYSSLLNKMGRNDEMIRLIGYHSMNNPIQIWRLINKRNNPHKRIKKH